MNSAPPSAHQPILRRLVAGIIPAMIGILGNLLAGWLQTFIVFTPAIVVALIALTLGLILLEHAVPRISLLILIIGGSFFSMMLIIVFNLFFRVGPNPQSPVTNAVAPLLSNQPVQGTLSQGQTRCYSSITEHTPATVQVTVTANDGLDYQLWVKIQDGQEVLRESSPYGAEKAISFTPEANRPYLICIQGYDDYSKGGYLMLATVN